MPKNKTKALVGKAMYLARSAFLYFSPRASRCPNCGGEGRELVDRKYVVTRLIRCDSCKLLYRTPIDGEIFNKLFYNFLYVESDKMDLPDDKLLESMKKVNFSGYWSDYSGFIEFLKRYNILPGTRIFDFGCSWGYGSYQFRQAGYDVYSYEIGVKRRNYGIEKLGVEHIDDPYSIKPGHPLHESFDCFFSAHVLEHVPAPSKVFDLAWQCLKPGGAFVAFTPNGCEAYRQYAPDSWRSMWGLVHPNFLDNIFYDQHFGNSRRLYASRDGSDLHKQYELGFVAWKSPGKATF